MLTLLYVGLSYIRSVQELYLYVFLWCGVSLLLRLSKSSDEYFFHPWCELSLAIAYIFTFAVVSCHTGPKCRSQDRGRLKTPSRGLFIAGGGFPWGAAERRRQRRTTLGEGTGTTAYMKIHYDENMMMI